uniref:Shikimate dehydrogenase (NADP(+)) n=1 Tax=uncultured Vibrionales bacterium HF0010_22E23 TaxID=710999 RepID=E0XRI5_9GAMM|nr:shikimate 5-dehydrogenase [uncultured Vibrionales bacterium HF0010_22E23]
MSGTDQYLVVGNPINHSKSPFIHAEFAKSTGEVLTYEKLEVAKDGFVDTMSAFFAGNGKGCNVTVPFKEEAYQFATTLTERARLAGAVNTLKLMDDGSILGDNTDGQGLVADLLDHDVALTGARILLIGAGGAARGVILPLLAHQPKEIIIANRTTSKAVALAENFDVHAKSHQSQITACEMCALEGVFDVIINSTAASLSGERPAIDAGTIGSTTVMYDMAYGVGETSSNQWAREQGAKQVIDGLGMLVGQAAESFYVWRGVRPETQSVLSALRQSLA